MAIQRLNESEPSSASQLPFWDPSAGTDRRASLQAIAQALQPLLSQSSGFVTQYASPAASGFNIAISPPTNGANVYLLLTPIAGYAAGTFTLPASTTLIDGQELLFFTTQSVTALTIALNGATAALGAPTTLAANAFFRLRYDKVNNTWYRVG